MSRKSILRTFLVALAAAIVGAGVATLVKGGLIPSGYLRGYDSALSDNLRRLKPGIALYVMFSLYWSFAARDQAPTLRSEARWSTLLHQSLVTAAFALIVFPVPGLFQRILPDWRGLTIGGWALVGAGALFAIWARRHLGGNWSREVRIAVDHKLVRTGPYRFVRHPIYTGALAMYVGLALSSGRINALLGLALVLLAYWRKTTMEENLLAREFGAAFDQYRRNSWAILPPVI